MAYRAFPENPRGYTNPHVRDTEPPSHEKSAAQIEFETRRQAKGSNVSNRENPRAYANPHVKAQTLEEETLVQMQFEHKKALRWLPIALLQLISLLVVVHVVRGKTRCSMAVRVDAVCICCSNLFFCLTISILFI